MAGRTRVLPCGHDIASESVLGHCRACDLLYVAADELGDGDLWHGDLNEVLHALAGKEPCETACTHYVDDLIGTWTLLGLANVATRSVQRVPASESNDG